MGGDALARGMARALPPSRGARSGAWRRLSREIRTCTKCPLHVGRTHAVVYRGGSHPWVVFVGEAPGAEEDRTGRPFVGRAGRRLDSMIERVGLAAGEFGVVNLLKCRPAENRFDRTAAATCRPYLDRQLELLAPRAVVTLGRWALTTLDPGSPPVTQAAGIPRTVGGRPLFPLLHPAALRSRATLARWERDAAALASWLGPLRA